MRGIILAIVAMGFSFSVSAKDFRVTGTITDQGMRALRNAVEASVRSGDSVVRVILDSDGGDLIAALATYDYLRSLRARVEIWAGSDCASSCTVIFAAGRVRQARSGTTFLFHRVEVGGAGSRGRRDEIRRYYAQRWLGAVASVDDKLASDLERSGVFLNSPDGKKFSGRRLSGNGHSFVTGIY